jgi:RHS repeat-associated protein
MGDRVFVWNAENRLIRTEPKAVAAGDSRTEYAYDYMGRRVQKISYLFDGTDWVKGEERLFVYQGWNLVEEIRLAEGKEESRYFVWGLDLSQSLQGAGGVGGLLAMVEEGGSHLYAYDANGNVGQVVKASDGSLAAAYEYDPFGRLTASSGGMAEANPFRFSTKYFDGESGFYYYGYRYYAVALGRWVSRDPIEEEGGINLYGFVGNDPINSHDYLGLYDPFAWLKRILNFTLPGGGQPVAKELRATSQAASHLAKNAPWIVLEVAGHTLQAGVGIVMIAGPHGAIVGTGGAVLVVDSIDKLQALARGDRSTYEKWLDNSGLSAEEKKWAYCAKEISILAIDFSGLARSTPKVGQHFDILVRETRVTFGNEIGAVGDIVSVRAQIVAKGAKPANLSPSGVGRSGAFNEAKGQSGIPTSQQPSRVLQNVDKRGNPQPGRIYEYEVSAPGGGTRTVRIRDDAEGHDFGPGNAQNHGRHFNDEAGNHYDY